jgi:Family of unknown function (DUF6521)
MTAWVDRPPEEARLLNPGFLVALLMAAASDYQRTAEQRMPWVLSFVIPPLVLPARSRGALPSNVRAHFPNWLQQHPEVRLGFPQRARPLVPLVREALRLGLRSGALRLDGAALLALAQPRARHETSHEVRDCFRAARLVGRWFASSQHVVTIYGLLGIRP